MDTATSIVDPEQVAADHPLRLAIGSHSAGSGKGCAMNVISWENGDTTITDFPSCADPWLSRMVQLVNDYYCRHLDEEQRLCPACSVEVLALAHRLSGTRRHDERNLLLPASVLAPLKESASHATKRHRHEALAAAHRAIDAFYHHYDLNEHQTDEQTVTVAIERMLAVTR